MYDMYADLNVYIFLFIYLFINVLSQIHAVGCPLHRADE